MKNYFSSVNHFVNFMKKVYSKDIDSDELKMVWRVDLQDRLSWDARSDKSVLNDIPGWIKKHTSLGRANEANKKVGYIYDSTRKFDKLTMDLEKDPGVYVFSTDDDTLYVGMSSNLGERARRSFIDRVIKTKITKEVYFSYYKTDSLSDAKVLEIIIIAELKPILNKITKYNDALTAKISHKYVQSSKITCKN